MLNYDASLPQLPHSVEHILLILSQNIFPGGISGEPACQCSRHETRVRSLDWEDPLEQGMATHSSILAWRIPWTEEPTLWATLHRVAKSQTPLKLHFTDHSLLSISTTLYSHSLSDYYNQSFWHQAPYSIPTTHWGRNHCMDSFSCLKYHEKGPI